MQQKILNLISQNPTKIANDVAKDVGTSRQYVSVVAKKNNIIMPRKHKRVYVCSECGASITIFSTSGLCKACLKKSKRVVANSGECGTEHSFLKSQYKRTKMHFCSNLCKGNWLGKHWLGIHCGRGRPKSKEHQKC